MDLLNEEDQLTNLELEIDSDAKQSLDSAAYWAKFIAIFIFSIGALVILFLIAMSMNSEFMDGFKSAFRQRIGLLDDFSGGLFIVIMVVALLLLCVVYYFLYNFGVKTKTALVSENIDELNKGLNSLKIYFIIMGIMGILGIVLELLTFTNLI